MTSMPHLSAPVHPSQSRQEVVLGVDMHNRVKNCSLARAVSGTAWREFHSMLEYKAAWYGRTLVAVDRWFPSSKLCSACGGQVHDRDVNAARNVLAAGLAES